MAQGGVAGPPGTKESSKLLWPTLNEALPFLRRMEAPCSNCQLLPGQGYGLCKGAIPGRRSCDICTARGKSCSTGTNADKELVEQYEKSYTSGRPLRPVESEDAANCREMVARPCGNCAAEEAQNGLSVHCTGWWPGSTDCNSCVRKLKKMTRETKQELKSEEHMKREEVPPTDIKTEHCPQTETKTEHYPQTHIKSEYLPPTAIKTEPPPPTNVTICCSKGETADPQMLEACLREKALSDQGYEGFVSTKIYQIKPVTSKRTYKPWVDLYGGRELGARRPGQLATQQPRSASWQPPFDHHKALGAQESHYDFSTQPRFGNQRLLLPKPPQ
ncbi:hypothetical protein V8F20_004159 [Naviculisporaceae sp. PSN 640]